MIHLTYRTIKHINIIVQKVTLKQVTSSPCWFDVGPLPLFTSQDENNALIYKIPEYNYK